jgi:hypothetical protein
MAACSMGIYNVRPYLPTIIYMPFIIYVHESYVRKKVPTAKLKAIKVQSLPMEKPTQETKKIISAADPGFFHSGSGSATLN